MNKTPKEEAYFIADFKRNQERQLEKFSKRRKIRLRSAVFDLPEFADAPLVSVVILVSDQREMGLLEKFIIENSNNKNVEVAILLPTDVFLSENYSTIHTYDLKKANQCSWLNHVAKEMSGKIICLVTSLVNFDKANLVEMVDEIKENENSQASLLGSSDRMTGLALTCDAYYLMRGLDELIEDVEVALLDLTLRLEMAGLEISSKNWPRSNVHKGGLKNKLAGRLSVNQGSSSFGSLG